MYLGHADSCMQLLLAICEHKWYACCRLQHQLQLYLLQQHVESKLAVSLLPLGRIGESGAAVGSPTSQQALAQIRLAHAFLCKGAAKGLCTIMQEQPE